MYNDQTQTVTVAIPLGIRDFFINSELGTGLSYDQMMRELGLSYETLLEYALLAWPSYIQHVMSNRDDLFYDYLMAMFGDDLGPLDGLGSSPGYQEALSRNAEILTRLVETIDNQLCKWFGEDFFDHPYSPSHVTLHRLYGDHVNLHLHYDPQMARTL